MTKAVRRDDADLRPLSAAFIQPRPCVLFVCWMRPLGDLMRVDVGSRVLTAAVISADVTSLSSPFMEKRKKKTLFALTRLRQTGRAHFICVHSLGLDLQPRLSAKKEKLPFLNQISIFEGPS